MRIRTVKQELEAKLKPTPACPFRNAKGKTEWKTFGDGGREWKVAVFYIDLPDQTPLEVNLNGRQVAQLFLQAGSARFLLESDKGDVIEEAHLDDVLQVTRGGVILLEGKFYLD